ncbi:large conductance mechanosensitive channel protein MscL [Kribbella solani]|uniref:large conductance mechanosensitive channel protein MscL n=1 Tax=Kribbella solani TaxID=236067 RepID=UPI0029AD60AE|nr:large conductance mechanosensitive channel protein MscL [Kribbella solani]MDX3004254.1 large conductance mechanosensitive channel protein MscL [Kribbella solani]
MLKGFKEFVMRGNVIDLAVAVVIGAAFGAIVTALVENLINPLIAAIFGKADISKVWNFTLNGADFKIGLILQAALNFLFVAAAVYFFIVLPLNKLAERRKRGQEPEPAPLTADQELLTEIRDLLRAGSTDPRP